MPATSSSILALDVGSARIGVALASTAARLARPLTTLTNDEHWPPALQAILTAEKVSEIVVGWPRGLDGQVTAQTDYVEQFARRLEQFGLPVHLQDEALSSKRAEAELSQRGKIGTKADVDALAATYILEDYLADNA